MATEQSNEAQPEALEQRHRLQLWTSTGYPIVDNRYINLETETIQDYHQGGPISCYPGPPHLRLVWNNMSGSNEGDAFRGLVATGFITSTEWLVRLGNFLGRIGDGMKIESLNLTEYGIYVVSISDLDKQGIMGEMRRSGIFPAKRELPADLPAGNA